MPEGAAATYIASVETAPSSDVAERHTSSAPPPSRRALRALVEGASAAVGTLLALLALTYLVEFFFAHGPTQSPLPSPNDVRVRWPTLVVAGVVGFGFARRRFRRPDAEDGFPLAPLGLALLVALGGLGYHQVHAGRFLDTYGAASCGGQLHLAGVGLSSDCAATLDAGRHACAWLAAEPWGEPPYDPSVQSGIAIDSIYPRYVRDLGAADTPEQRLRQKVAKGAWTELCPLQRLVHRQMRGSD